MVNQPSPLVHPLHELAKTSDHFAIPRKQRVHFGQNHAFGGIRSCLLGVFREMEFGDRRMKTGETLCVVRLCERFTPVSGTRR
jgi:hypothetical protein